MTIACDVPILNIITKGLGYVFVIMWICFIFRNTSKRGESFGISLIGNKIKGVFKSTTMEGAMLPSYGLAEGEDDMVSALMLVLVKIKSKTILVREELGGGVGVLYSDKLS